MIGVASRISKTRSAAARACCTVVITQARSRAGQIIIVR
jgi:hypothetical protein